MPEPDGFHQTGARPVDGLFNLAQAIDQKLALHGLSRFAVLTGEFDQKRAQAIACQRLGRRQRLRDNLGVRAHHEQCGRAGLAKFDEYVLDMRGFSFHRKEALGLHPEGAESLA